MQCSRVYLQCSVQWWLAVQSYSKGHQLRVEEVLLLLPLLLQFQCKCMQSDILHWCHSELLLPLLVQCTTAQCTVQCTVQCKVQYTVQCKCMQSDVLRWCHGEWQQWGDQAGRGKYQYNIIVIIIVVIMITIIIVVIIIRAINAINIWKRNDGKQAYMYSRLLLLRGKVFTLLCI